MGGKWRNDVATFCVGLESGRLIPVVMSCRFTKLVRTKAVISICVIAEMRKKPWIASNTPTQYHFYAPT